MHTVYFAYGSNMDPSQMDERCPGAEPAGVARLDGYEIRFTYDSPGWEGGVATVVPVEGSEVWGVLWTLDDEHVATLDRYEGVPEVYRREHVEVLAGEGAVQAMIYVANEVTETPPAARYIDGIIRGARHFGLPDDYLRALASLAAS